MTTAGLPLSRFCVTLEEYQQQRQAFFASMPSLRWFVQCHLADLVNAKALIVVGRTYRVDPGAFDDVVEAEGLRRAAERAAA